MGRPKEKEMETVPTSPFGEPSLGARMTMLSADALAICLIAAVTAKILLHRHPAPHQPPPQLKSIQHPRPL